MSNIGAAAVQGLSATLNLVGKNLQSAKANSYIEFSKMTLVEAPTIVDASIGQLPITAAVLQSAINQFSVYYIQAATIHMNIGRVNINKILDPLNPKRDPGSAFFSNLNIGNESAGLLSFDQGLSSFGAESFGLETISFNLGSKDAKLDASYNVKLEDGSGGGMSGRDINGVVKDAVNLSVGKVISLEVIEGEAKANIPITIRLRTGIMDTQPLTTLMSANQVPRGFMARLRGVKAGDLSMWRDFVACRDLIKEHRDALLKDTTGMYRERIKTSRKNKLSAVLTLKPSIANLSSIYVVSSETLENMAAYKRVDFSNAKTREKILEVTGAMIFAVVNAKWETVTFWRHSIPEPAEFTFQQIQKEFSNPKDVNLQEMMRTMGMFANPTF